ncbi:putative Mce family protein [Gordonia crocea]|uniref:Putative Mce family protein n=1 Tax=Gordonia crocea TaxID=589162 RepID=A0A7M3SVG8_9ACTN|nr:putative Mce family protein [Gordonia crocea]
MSAGWRRAVLAVVVAALVAGCDLGVVPGANRDDTYRLNIEFSSVLNIPSGAKVLVDGVPVGRLAGVALRRDRAVVTITLDRKRLLPDSTRAELRQMTLLGDLYIALVPPSGADGPMLRDGATIPITQTEPPANVETTLLSLSQFINGGLLARAQELGRKANAALPGPDELRRLSGSAAHQLSQLGDSVDRMDRLVQNGSAMVGSLARNRATVERTLTIGPERFAAIQQMLLSIIELIADLRVLTKPGGDLLAGRTYPDLKRMLSQANPWLMEIARADTSVPENLTALRDLLVAKIQPFLLGRGQVDITRIDDTKGRATKVVDLLQAIGVV